VSPDVSVVIPALHADATLPVQLAALAAQRTSVRFEVLVADNAGSPATRALVEGFAARGLAVRWLDAGASVGTNRARNVGTAAARADKVLLCDADDRVREGWVEAMSAALDRADAVAGRLDRVPLNGAYIRRWGTPTGHDGLTVQLGFLPRPLAANAGFRRPVWQQLGGFDPAYVRGGTDTEFFWRLQLAGHSLVDVPEAVVDYRVRSDARAAVRQMYVWGRQAPMLYRDFRSCGLTWDPTEAPRALLWLLRTAPGQLRSARGRLELARGLAYRVGRLRGSLRYRVLFL